MEGVLFGKAKTINPAQRLYASQLCLNAFCIDLKNVCTFSSFDYFDACKAKLCADCMVELDTKSPDCGVPNQEKNIQWCFTEILKLTFF